MKNGESMTDGSVVCARCGRTISKPVYVDGVPYGSTCAKHVREGTQVKNSKRSSKKSSKSRSAKKVEETESLDAFLAQPIVEY